MLTAFQVRGMNSIYTERLYTQTASALVGEHVRKSESQRHRGLESLGKGVINKNEYLHSVPRAFG